MRALLVSILTLVSLAGCLQPTTPFQHIKDVSISARTVATADQPELLLSVQTNPHEVTAGGIMAITLVFSTAGSEPVVLGPLGDPWVLDLDAFDGERVVEYSGFFYARTTITSKSPSTGYMEVPVYRFVPGGEVIPYDPGVYRWTLSMKNRPSKSLPCIFQIFAPRDPTGQVAAEP